MARPVGENDLDVIRRTLDRAEQRFDHGFAVWVAGFKDAPKPKAVTPGARLNFQPIASARSKQSAKPNATLIPKGTQGHSPFSF